MQQTLRATSRVTAGGDELRERNLALGALRSRLTFAPAVALAADVARPRHAVAPATLAGGRRSTTPTCAPIPSLEGFHLFLDTVNELFWNIPRPTSTPRNSGSTPRLLLLLDRPTSTVPPLISSLFLLGIARDESGWSHGHPRRSYELLFRARGGFILQRVEHRVRLRYHRPAGGVRQSARAPRSGGGD